MSDSADSPQRRPGSRRTSNPPPQRLDRITEGPYGIYPHAPPIPPKSSRRNSGSNLSLPHSIVVTPPQPAFTRRYSTENSARSGRTAPPAYEWVPEPVGVDDDDDRGPVEGEKLAAFRKAGGYKRRMRGTSQHLIIVVVLAVLVALGLIIGLAVGLTTGKKKSSSNIGAGAGPGGSSSNNASSQVEQPFPLGEFSIVTALKTVTTNCTSNPDTWNCYPYHIFDSADPSSASTSMSTFKWIIANTSSSFAGNNSGTTPDQGVPANLTISSSDNPFSITFANQSLTYIAPSSNSSSARFTFSFTTEKAYIPTVSIGNNNGVAQCFFNQTVFTATLYLSEARNYPGQDNSTSGASMEWPYAIDITQDSPGGDNTPACYQYQDGAIGARITTGLTAEPASAQCLCEYRNY